MGIRLLAIDMDGTALNTRNALTEPTRRALQAAIDAGVCVVPATGRQFHGLPPELGKLRGLRYFLCSNGAVVYDRQQGRTLHRALLPKAKALSALYLLLPASLSVDVYLQGRAFATAAAYADPLAHGVRRAQLATYRACRTPKRDLCAFVRDSGQNPEKLFAIFDDMPARKRCWDALAADPALDVTCSFPEGLELCSCAATKGRGLSALAGALGVPQSSVMAVGDGLNDLSMLDWAGLSVAMGNAPGAVKAHARALTAPCDEDGLALAVRRYILAPGGGA